MNFYWLYDLPNWLFAAVVVGFFTGFGVGGVLLTRRWVRRLHQIDHSHNDIVGYFLGAITVIYGITLGLVAVGTWESFSAAQNQVDLEAQTISALYRDVAGYDTPMRDALRADLVRYTRNVVDIGWPLQRRGIIPAASGRFLDHFQDTLLHFKPADISQSIVQTEAFKQYNALVEARRARLRWTTAGLPGSIWALVILGGMATVIVSLFFDTKSRGMHLWMTGLSSALLGLVIFLIGTLDNPFRGKVSVTPDAYQLVYTQLMAPDLPEHRPR